MKKSLSYYRIKWTAFFVTVFVLTIGLTALYLARPKAASNPPENANINHSEFTPKSKNSYSNETFSRLIEQNLSAFHFTESISFQGEGNGCFSISGILTSPKRLIALCAELAPYESILNSFSGKKVCIRGHIGMKENGHGCFIADTVLLSDQPITAPIATDYIEKYTDLNSLLDVPFSQITLSDSGISFLGESPAAIQTAFHNLQDPVPSE